MPSSHLLRRGKHYYLRLHIPLDLRPWFGGRRELRKSLRTAKYTYAKSSLRGHLYLAERLFTLMRSAMLNDEQIRELVSDYLKQTLKEEEDAKAEGIGLPADSDEHIEMLQTRELLLVDARENLAMGRYDVVGNVADLILDAAAISIPKGSLAYRKLCQELLKGFVQVSVVEIERLKGNYESEYDWQSSYVSAPVLPEVPAKKGQDEGEPLSKLISEYVSECVTGGRWRGRTKGEAEGVFEVFLRIVGEDRGIRTLDRRTLTDFRDTLRCWPSNVNKRAEFQGKSVDEILSMKPEQTLSLTSINKYLTYVRAFLGWCKASGYIDTNFAEKLTVKASTHEQKPEQRETYSIDDLKRLLRCPIYDPAARERKDKWTTTQEAFWLPLLGLFTGARLGELTQLHVGDVREEEGIPFLDINDDAPDKKLKNPSSKRRIPLHPVLVDLGFLSYVESVRKQRGDKKPLWNLKLKRGSRGEDFGRFYQRINRKYIAPENQKRVYHSLRHTYGDAHKQLLTPEPIFRELMGHSHAGAGEGMTRYGKRYELPLLLSYVEKVSFVGIEEELRKLPRFDATL
jgi:integrase